MSDDERESKILSQISLYVYRHEQKKQHSK